MQIAEKLSTSGTGAGLLPLSGWWEGDVVLEGRASRNVQSIPQCIISKRLYYVSVGMPYIICCKGFGLSAPLGKSYQVQTMGSSQCWFNGLIYHAMLSSLACGSTSWDTQKKSHKSGFTLNPYPLLILWFMLVVFFALITQKGGMTCL